MALDPNIGKIKVLRSKTANAVPSAALLDEGELAVNLVDRTIFSKNGASVVELGFGKGGTVAGAINQTVGGITTTGTITAPTFSGALSGNASTATKLQTVRTISLTGSATGSISFDGTSNQSISVNVNKLDTLATYARSNDDSPKKWAQGVQSVFVSSAQGWPLAYGGVITARPHSNGGGTLQILTAYGTGSTVGGGEIKIRTGDYSGAENDAWTSWKTLVHSENVNDYSPTKTGVGASGTWGIAVTGNAATATALQTARTIGGVSFNGSANINLPGVNVAGNQSTSGNAATATKLQTPRTINNVAFDGSANIDVPIYTISRTAEEIDSINQSAFFRSDEGSGTLGLHIHNPTNGSYGFQIHQSGTYAKNQLKTRVKSGGTWSSYRELAYTDSSITGNAATASKLAAARTISLTGDATGSLSFDGSANAAAALTLANTGIAAGTYKSITVDAKGRATGGNDVVTSLVTSTSATGTSNVATTNTNTFLNIVEYVGATAVSSAGSSSQITGAGTVTVTSDTTGKITITGSQDITGNAATATKLQTSRTIAISGAVTGTATGFDGSANIAIATTAIDGSKISTGTIPAARIPTLNQSTTGNAGSATKLQTTRLINGVDFDGTTDIQIDAIRVGTITWHLGERSSIFAGDLSLDGQILNRADYPELWSMVNAGRFASVTDAVWLSDVSKRGSYSTGNGSTTFRLPDLNGGQAGSIPDLFLRGSSTTPVGTVLSDAIRNITGNLGDSRAIGTKLTSGAFSYVVGADSTGTGSAGTAISNFTFDASRVVPTADENRPKSVFGIWVVSARGSNVVVPGGSTAATLTGGNTFQGSQTINGDLVVKQNVKVEGITTDRFGFYDKMYWAGAINRPNAENVLVTPLDANRFTAYLTLNSGSQYINFGTSKIHMIQNWASATPNYIQATIDSSVDANAGKQVITLTCTLPNHGILAATNFFWIAITYESFGCEIDQYIANGDLRFVSRLKSDSAFVSKSPIVSISSSSSEWFSGTQSGTGKPEIGPGASSSAPIVAAVSGQHISFVGVGGIQVPYVTISVKDRII